MAYIVGIVVLVVLWLLYRILVGTWNPWKLVIGNDGRASTSKLQWFLWTLVVIFAYTSVYAARAITGHLDTLDIPRNLLIAMGLSAITMATAKGITVSYVTNSLVVKTNPAVQAKPTATGPGAIFQDDSGFPDLSKTQMLAWTFVAIGIFLLQVTRQIGATSAVPQLPDLDPTLIVLMGLGQGAYLGKKLTTTDTPRLTGLSPGSGPAGPTVITLTGVAFGAEQNGSLITFDGNATNVMVKSWTDAQITFTISPTQLDGTPWTRGQRVNIGVIAGGLASANTLPFTIG